MTASGLPRTWISASTGAGAIATATPRTAQKPRLGKRMARTRTIAELVNFSLPADADFLWPQVGGWMVSVLCIRSENTDPRANRPSGTRRCGTIIWNCGAIASQRSHQARRPRPASITQTADHIDGCPQRRGDAHCISRPPWQAAPRRSSWRESLQRSPVLPRPQLNAARAVTAMTARHLRYRCRPQFLEQHPIPMRHCSVHGDPQSHDCEGGDDGSYGSS